MVFSDDIGIGFTIDVEALKDADIAQLAVSLSNNREKIGLQYTQLAEELIGRGKVEGNEPAFSFAPEFRKSTDFSWYTSISRRLGSSGGSVMTHILPLAVYLHDCYGISCSKFFLGKEARTIPPLWVRNWVASAARLSPANKNLLYGIFENGNTIRKETLYVLKSRIYELADERGIRRKDFFLPDGLLPRDVVFLRNFVGVTLHEGGDPYEVQKKYLGNHVMIRLVILFSVLYQTSPDYLLLQDYSEYAMNAAGRFYSGEERRFLSMLLQADTATQSMAVGFVNAVSASEIADAPAQPVDEGSDFERIIYEEKKRHPMYVPGTSGSELVEAFGLPPRTNAERSKDTNNHRIQKKKEALEPIKPLIIAILKKRESATRAQILEEANISFALGKNALEDLEDEGIVMHIGSRAGGYWRLAPVKEDDT